VRRPPGANRLQDFFDTYTRDLTAEDLQRLFTRDTREAYKFFTRGVDADALNALPWHRRAVGHARLLFLAFTMKLSPARRVLYGAALLLAAIGLFNLFRGIGIVEITRLPFVGGVGVPGPLFRQGTWSLLFAFALMNLLVLLEVADRLSLKNDLEIAREIQQAMLPSGLYSAPGVETVGISRPANTVGGDFYDILPLDDGRLVVTVGDVAGKGSPAALLMALLLAMLRTLVDEKLEPAELITRLNVQVCRHAPGSRFIIALGMFDHSVYKTGHLTIQPDEVLAVYSDGVTEAENAAGRPFDEEGLEKALKSNRTQPITSMGAAIVRTVEHHSADTRLADDLTILLLRRLAIVGV
jgi:sigma-B regulation protein RsbU (phosphoserine phosphatase)